MKDDIKIYVGPHCLNQLQRNTLFRNGVHPSFAPIIKQCPAVGELIVPIEKYAEVRKELNFDYTGNMRGTSGKYVTFFQTVQKWISERANKTKEPSTGVEQHHA